MASPPSSPSDSSLLAFSYNSLGLDGVDYPHGHDQSLPQTPASTSTAGPITYFPQSSGQAKTSLAPSRLSFQSKHIVVGNEEEYEIGAVGGKKTRGSEDIESFSKGELVVMSGSSLMVLDLGECWASMGIKFRVGCLFHRPLENMKEESRDEVRYRDMIWSPRKTTGARGGYTTGCNYVISSSLGAEVAWNVA
ncbi:hypothetical protein JB92DRAFT_3100743 [Gautieria morchelliformis]|nr:hypothetical protein JB92DRAFT_3100743 [Gautieria morchelliformis]